MPFRDIVGHRAPLALLSRAVAHGTLPQGLIFAGPEGVGKRLTAVALAQALNCLRPVPSPDGGSPDPRPDEPDPTPNEVDACGSCAACRRIAALAHPDVVVVGANPPIDEVREAVQSSGYRPFEGRRRVFILDDADMLSAAVQNALLKTLEEPSASSQFVLIASRPAMLLLTVTSRCPTLRFGRLAVSDVERWLVTHHGYSEQAAREAALAAEGSPGRALSEASDDGAAVRGLAERVVEGIAAARTPEQRLRAAQELMAPQSSSRGRARAKVSRWASDREMVAERLNAVGSVLRDLSVRAVSGDPQWLSRAETPDLERVAGGLKASALAEAFDAVSQAQGALDRNVSPKVVVDWLAMQIARQ